MGFMTVGVISFVLQIKNSFKKKSKLQFTSWMLLNVHATCKQQY